MFPCQWKTIAPFLGRSAHMCIEHFQELLDKAENRQVDPNNDPRKLNQEKLVLIQKQDQQDQIQLI